MFGSKRKMVTAGGLIARANAARDERRYRDAAALFAEALRLDPGRGDIELQAGHMFKEAGELPDAEKHYERAARLMPESAEVQMQLGHFYKVAGRLAGATRAYRKALERSPGWAEVERELALIEQAGWQADDQDLVAVRAQPVLTLADDEPEVRPDHLKLAPLYGYLAPELLPQPVRQMLRYSDDSIALRQFGVEQSTFWGHKRVARGVEAIRGVCVSKARLLGIEARVNGILVHKGALKGPYELEYEPDKNRIHKYVFNIWTDFSNFVPGRYELELLIKVVGEENRFLLEEFVVEAPLSEAEFPDSDGIINLDPAFRGLIEDEINGRPSIVHEAERPDQLGEVRSILVSRSDQLGDFVASIPGILKLRELFPDATMIGLFSNANVGLARSLNVFEDIVIVDHREEWHQRARILTLAEQREIRAKLEPYRFDLAIDLAQSLMGRPILALSGARFLYGFRDPNWSRLSSSYDDAMSDPKNRREFATHSKRIMNLIERLGTLRRATGKVIRRDDLHRAQLARYGIAEGERYAALHTGARIVWSRWAHYLELASRLLRDTDLKVAIFTGDPELRDNLPPDLAGSSRLIILDQQLPFDDFDALLSFCDVYVGNDSGPKHLASLRGVPVVSVHSSRINWSEWGQEHTGVIISRKVPCAGCHIYHDPDECGKDFACMKIGFDDVYAAVRRYV